MKLCYVSKEQKLALFIVVDEALLVDYIVPALVNLSLRDDLASCRIIRALQAAAKWVCLN